MRPQKIWSIYLIQHNATGMAYIGQTALEEPRGRWYEHCLVAYRAGRKGSSQLLTQMIRESGEAAFTFEVIACCLTRANADAIETQLIRQWQTFHPKGFNLTEGGRGGFRRAISPEVTARRVAAHKAAFAKPDVQERHRAAVKAAMLDPEVNARLRAGIRAANLRPEVQQSRSDAATAAFAKHRDKYLAAASDPERRRRISEGVRAARARPEVKEKYSAAMKIRMQDPATKARWSDRMRLFNAARKAERLAEGRARWATVRNSGQHNAGFAAPPTQASLDFGLPPAALISSYKNAHYEMFEIPTGRWFKRQGDDWIDEGGQPVNWDDDSKRDWQQALWPRVYYRNGKRFATGMGARWVSSDERWGKNA